MKKKFLSLFMVIAITIFQFAPTMVTALSYDLNDGDIINSYNVTSDVVTLYVGNISVDGTSTLKYLYTDKSVNTETLTEMRKILTSDYASLLPTTAGQVAVSNDSSVTVNDVFTDAGMVAINKYPSGTVSDTSSTILYNQTQYISLATASQAEISDEATAETNNLSAWNTRKNQWDTEEQNKVNVDPEYTPVSFPEEYRNAFKDTTTYPTSSFFIADNKGESSIGYIIRNGVVAQVNTYPLNRTIIKVVNTSANVTTTSNEPQIIRNTTTNYHTRVMGTLNITGTDTYSKNYNSGEDYIDGNYTDVNVEAIINSYKDDMSSIADSYNRATYSVSGGINDYYYEAHDEITQSASCPTNLDNVNYNDYPDCTITINTVLDKYQTYKITGNATTKNIKNININLTAPTIGEKVTLTKDTNIVCLDPNGCWTADKTPTATSSDNITIDDTAWVMGTYLEYGDGYDNYFEGTFEKDKYYYAMISISTKDGYKLSNDLTIKVNGEAPAEVFAVYNNDNTYFIAKIKATTPTYKVIEGAGQTYTIEKDTSAIFKINADYSLFENGGKVYVDDELVDSSNYTSKSGSTIITFTKDYMNSLSVGTHNLKVVFNDDGSAETTFTIAEKTSSNPQTGDNIMFYISMLGLSIIGLAGAGLYIRKRLFNK